ncbi:PREDICTED: uncharacterized protein LOC105127407 [Populus euphratica]|uniref:Uncharacterized protein LOC105127407 n=1 Tax=Populus euphratica TaxID=75702 RepID=A0AAJ6UCH4_POPEU|nr:PREDICTED: uncharacterized protein LOC105127407 [Populus euphratica]
MASSYLPSAYPATQRRSSQTYYLPLIFENHLTLPEIGFLSILIFLLQLSSFYFDTRNGDGIGDDGMLHVVSWMDCLDLGVLAVLANSTLSSSSYPELVSFHFFIPGGDEDKVPFYKLKVLFPHSNLELHGQEEVEEIVRIAFSDEQYAKPSYEEIVPFIISTVHQFLSKFIYISVNVIMKARVEELIGVDLDDYAIATAEDCSQRLKNNVNSDVLDAIQRSVSKPWV